MNEALKRSCLSKAIRSIDERNININTHNNYGGLHLTTKGSKVVGNNVLNVAKKFRICD